MGMGYENLSMSASTLLRVKSMLLNTSRQDASRIVKRALRLSDAESIAQFISASLKQPEVVKLIRSSSTNQRSTMR
jgi:phosphotransferase system enzyme I (PtsP)